MGVESAGRPKTFSYHFTDAFRSLTATLASTLSIDMTDPFVTRLHERTHGACPLGLRDGEASCHEVRLQRRPAAGYFTFMATSLEQIPLKTIDGHDSTLGAFAGRVRLV